MSRLCPALPDFAALSRNPARLYKWRCGTSINSVYYRISVRISRCLVGVAAHDRPKVGVVDQKWAWSVNFRARFARVNTIFYFVPASLLIHLATMLIGKSSLQASGWLIVVNRSLLAHQVLSPSCTRLAPVTVSYMNLL